MIGAEIYYKLPTENGWRRLKGTVVAAHSTALVVQTFGMKRTINPGQLISYIWKQTAA